MMNLSPQSDKFLKRSLSGLIAGACFFTAAAWAQDAANAAPVTAPAYSRPLWTEALITVLMIGLALFAVGRNSNRT